MFDFNNPTFPMVAIPGLDQQIDESRTQFDKEVDSAPLGNGNYNRVVIGDMIRFAPILTELTNVIEADRRVRAISNTRIYNLRVITAASTRILLDINIEDLAAKEVLYQAALTAGVDLATLTAVPVDFEKTLNVTNLLTHQVGSLQDFKQRLEPSDSTLNYWYYCFTQALQLNNQREGAPEWRYLPFCYTDNTKWSTLVGKIKWDKPDALTKWNEAQNVLLASQVKPGMAKAANLVKTPVFRAVPIIQST